MEASIHSVSNSQVSISNNSQDRDAASSNPTLKKIGEIAYEVLGYVPVIGTFIGAHHLYKAITSDEEISGMEKLQIYTQLFSFLIVPQIVYGFACAGGAIGNHLQDQWQFDLQVERNIVNPVSNDDDADWGDELPRNGSDRPFVDRMPKIIHDPLSVINNPRPDHHDYSVETPDNGSGRVYPQIQVKVQTPDGEVEMSYEQAVRQGYRQ